MIYNDPSLQLLEDRVVDALGEIRLADLPDPSPICLAEAPANATPLVRRLWKIALADVESNLLETPEGTYFGAGDVFGPTVFTRDISLSGVLALNRLWPEEMLSSLRYSRVVRRRIGWRIPKPYAEAGRGLPVQVEDLDHKGFKLYFGSNSILRRTDDVVWLWAAWDLLAERGTDEDVAWMVDTAGEFFETFYDHFYDESVGLYRGQACFIDIHFPTHQATGYPQDWSVGDCLRIFPTSTNCLYVKAFDVLCEACGRLNRSDDAAAWRHRGERLREAIVQNLRRADGTFAYYRGPDGMLTEHREVLGAAWVVAFDVVTGDDARAALADYPVTPAGVPIITPFWPWEQAYHNRAAWPFSDAFFLGARQKAFGVEESAHVAALCGRTVREGGTFHEWCRLPDGGVGGSGGQLWTAAAFLNACGA